MTDETRDALELGDIVIDKFNMVGKIIKFDGERARVKYVLGDIKALEIYYQWHHVNYINRIFR